MFSFSQNQLDTLSDRQEALLVADLAQHVHTIAPDHAKSIGADACEALARLAVERASEHEFSVRPAVRCYLEAMVLLGADFETDPQYPWAAEILSKHRIADIVRADMIHDACERYHREVIGAGFELEIAALQKLSRIDMGWVRENLADPVGAVARIYPEKADYCGHEALQATWDRARQHASGNSDEEAAVCFAAFAAFGTGCFGDPQRKALFDGISPQGGEARATALLEALATYARQAARVLGAAS